MSNPVYIGKVIWNRRQWVKNPETKRRVPRLRPESEWIITEQPALRIIPQNLWEAAQARRRGQQQRQRPGRGPKFLLSGLLTCGAPTEKAGEVCGANFVKADGYRYACASHLNRQTCQNDLRVPQRVVEARLLEGIKRDLFCDEGISLFVKETTRLLAERNRQRRPALERMQRRLTEVDHEIANIMTAIKQGLLTVSTKAELEKAEAERVYLIEQLSRGVANTDKMATLLPRAKEHYQAVLENLGTIPPEHVAKARVQIRELVGEIRLIPNPDGYLEAELTGHYEGLPKLVVGRKLNNVVAGEGFEPSTFGL